MDINYYAKIMELKQVVDKMADRAEAIRQYEMVIDENKKLLMAAKKKLEELQQKYLELITQFHL